MNSSLENINEILKRKNNIVELLNVIVLNIVEETKKLKKEIQNATKPPLMDDMDFGAQIAILTAKEIHEIIPNLFLGGLFYKTVKYLNGDVDSIKLPSSDLQLPKYDAVVHVVVNWEKEVDLKKKRQDDDFEFAVQPNIPENPDNIFQFTVQPGETAIGEKNFKQSEELFNAIKFIRRHLDQNHKVFVHCQQGVDRSTTVIIVYLMLYYDVTWEEALNYIRSKRYIAEPKPSFITVLESTAFQTTLAEYKSKIKI